MNCPVCNGPGLPEGITSCPNCSSELESFVHISRLDEQVKKQRQVILLVSGVLLLAVLAGVFLFSRMNQKTAIILNQYRQIDQLKMENGKMNNFISELKKQLEEKPVSSALPAVESTDASGNYVVKKGESLWTIAQKEMGDGFKNAQIARDNNIQDPDKIEIGTELKIKK